MVNFLRFFLGDELTEKPLRIKGAGGGQRSKKLAHVFIGAADPALAKSCRTFKSLNSITSGLIYGQPATYWTPNTFFRDDIRSKNTLRWINALVLDIDEEGLCLLDILDRVNIAGLPRPTMINKTPHGWHVYWAIVPVWAWPKVIKLYESILTDMIKAVDGSDPQVFGPERFFRLPKHVKQFVELRYTLFDFLTWRDINKPFDECRSGGSICYMTKCLSNPAVKYLLEGVEKGTRNNTAFTLALCFKKDDFDLDSTYNALLEWNKRNSPPMPIRILKKTVKSAFNEKWKGPSTLYIENLSGLKFRYRPITPAKARRDRNRNHLKEIQDDIISYISKCGGHVFGQSQETIANKLKVPLRSFKNALKYLRNAGKVIAIITGRGRARESLYALASTIADIIKNRTTKGIPYVNVNQLIEKLLVHTNIHFLGEVVGGSSLWITQILSYVEFNE